MRYYSVLEAKWITIGAQAKKPGTKGANGKKHGGVSVLISDDGTILKGPAHMKGKKPDELGGRQKTLGEKPGEKQEPKKYQNLAFGPDGEIAEPDAPKSPPPGAGYSDLRAAAKVEPVATPPAPPTAKPAKTKAAKAQKPPEDYDDKQDKKHARNLARLEKSRKDLADIGDAGRTLLAKAPPEMHAKIQGLIDRADAEKNNLATALKPKEFPDMGEPPPMVTDYTPGADYSDSYDDLRKAAAQPAPEPAPPPAAPAKPNPELAPTPEPKPEKGETVRAKIARVKSEKEKRYNDTLKKRGKKEADRQKADDKRQAKAEKDAANPVQAEARKKKQAERIGKINASRPQSLISLIKKGGGISSGDYDYQTDIKEYGLKSALNKRGLNIDAMATELMNAGHLVVPENQKPADVLLDGLQRRANSALHDHTGRYDSEYDDFINNREDADNAPGADSDQTASVISRGEEAGENQGDDDGLAQILGFEPGRSDADEPEPSDYGHPDDYEPEEGDLGDGGEITGADTSFDFGAPEPTPAPTPATAPEPAPTPATAPEPGAGYADLRAAAAQEPTAQIKEPQRGWTSERQDFHQTGIGGVNTHAGKTSDGTAEFDELKDKIGNDSGEISSVNLGELYKKHLNAAMAQGGVDKKALDAAIGEGPTGANYSRLTALNGEAARRTRAELKEKTGPYIAHNTDGAIAAGYHANPADMVPGATDTDYRKSSAAVITGPETQAKNYKAAYGKPAKSAPALAEPLFGNRPEPATAPAPTPATAPEPGAGYADLRAAAAGKPAPSKPLPGLADRIAKRGTPTTLSPAKPADTTDYDDPTEKARIAAFISRDLSGAASPAAAAKKLVRDLPFVSPEKFRARLDAVKTEFPTIYQAFKENPGIAGPDTHAEIAAHTGGEPPKEFPGAAPGGLSGAGYGDLRAAAAPAPTPATALEPGAGFADLRAAAKEPLATPPAPPEAPTAKGPDRRSYSERIGSGESPAEITAELDQRTDSARAQRDRPEATQAEKFTAQAEIEHAQNVRTEKARADFAEKMNKKAADAKSLASVEKPKITIEKSIGYSGKTGDPSYLAKISGKHNGKTFNREFQNGDEDKKAKSDAFRKKKGTYNETHEISPGELYEHAQNGTKKLLAIQPAIDGGTEGHKVSFEIAELKEASKILKSFDSSETPNPNGFGANADFVKPLLAHQAKMAKKAGSYEGLTLQVVAKDLEGR